MGLGAALGSIGGSLVSDAFNAWSAHEAREASENMYRHRYQIMVSDLKKAGLNPMLAYMKDAGTPPTTTPAHASGDLGSVINQARQSSAQSNLMKIQESQAAAQADLLNAQAEKTRTETKWIDRQAEAGIYKDTSTGQLNDALTATRSVLRPGELQKLNSEAEAAELMLPHYRNLSEAEKSEFKQKIAPYLKDVESMSRSAANAGVLLNINKLWSILDGMARSKGPTRYGPSGEKR